jgi:hypothetical protein
LGLYLVEGFSADFFEVGKELIGGALLGRDAGFGVASLLARSQVFVPDRAESCRAVLDQRRCGLPDPGEVPIQGFHQEDQGPACELSMSGTSRLAQTTKSGTGSLGDEIEAIRLSGKPLSASLDEPGERVELSLMAFDRGA